MAARPLVSVWTSADKADQFIPLPTVFTAPIRSDIVQEVHTGMAKNKRQPYAVSKLAGHQSSAESWGTGRAVARIPRVSGGGTHRAGQGAFGNMCRGGRMFAPTKVWRRWHVKVPLNQRRYATASALAASAVPALVMARGHRVERVPEIPLVIDSKIVEGVDKTKKAVALLKTLNAYDDVARVIDSHKIRVGKGKMRNRRYVQRRGPLVIYNEKGPLVKAFNNIPGVELVSVSALNLLQLAPGAHLGRFCIWTKDAFQRLDSLFGTYTRPSSEKNGYTLPKHLITTSDIGRIMASDEVQSALRDKKTPSTSVYRRKKNPFNNIEFYKRLNPYIQNLRRREILYSQSQHKKKQEAAEAARKGTQKKTKAKTPTKEQIESIKLLYSK